MSNISWQAIAFRDTDGIDTDGYLYLDIPDRREYKFISAVVKFERSSDVADSDRAVNEVRPTVDFVVSTASATHGAVAGQEDIHARFMANAEVPSTAPLYFVFAPEVPWQTSDVVSGWYYVPIPDFWLSTEFRVRISGQPSTGAVDVIEVHGIVGQRDNHGHRA